MCGSKLSQHGGPTSHALGTLASTRKNSDEPRTCYFEKKDGITSNPLTGAAKRCLALLPSTTYDEDRMHWPLGPITTLSPGKCWGQLGTRMTTGSAGATGELDAHELFGTCMRTS